MTEAPARLRSLLFVPGDRPDRLAKALASGADGVVVDLEDAVAAARLPQARTAVAGALRALPPASVPVVVRVHGAHDRNALELDIAAAASRRLTAVMLPKVSGPGDVRLLEGVMAAAGLDGTGVIPLIESCRGLRQVYEVASSSPRVLAMAFSSGEEGDFMADLGGRWTPDGLALQYARGAFLCDVRAAGGMLALDGVCMSLDDGAVLASECAIAATLGFDGKLAVHPSQIPVIHDTFTPSAAEVEDAKAVLSTLQGSGGPAARRHRGRMIDAANARVAHRVLARAGRPEDGVHGG